MKSPRKIVIVNTSDEGGGAERMSMALLDAFNERGIDTWLLVGDKRTTHPRVMPLYLSPYFDYKPYNTVFGLAATEWRRRAGRLLGLEDFSHPYAHHLTELTGSPPDLVLCHNLHGGYFDLRALPAISTKVPVVLRLFDTWLLTGHCAVPFGCERWENGCGRCPHLDTPPAIARDATRVNWWRKRRIMGKSKVFVSAETNWMLKRAKKSLLAPSVSDWSMIRGGVNLSIFSPGSKTAARQRLGLSEDANIILYVANHGSANAYKDLATVRQALADLPRRLPGTRTELVAIGASEPQEEIAPGVTLRWVGYVRSQSDMADFYRAADVFAHACAEEAFGLSVAEALACGAPVAAASGGGVLETVEHEKSGLVVPAGDAEQLAGAIVRLLEDRFLCAAMSSAGVSKARTELDERLMIDELLHWFAAIGPK